MWFHTKWIFLKKSPVDKCDIFPKYFNSKNVLQALHMNQDWKALSKSFLASLLALQLQFQT